MKRLSLVLGFVLLLTAGSLRAQGYKERIGLPGDNLNLYAVLAIFQESPTLEEFERRLNDPDKMVNNLDLNGDNMTDYIQVIDYPDNERHNIVLRVALSKRENQDIAVITVVKDRYDGVLIQVTGDPVLYGNNYIIEPNYYDDGDINVTPNPGYNGNRIDVNGVTINVNYTSGREIYGWPIARFLFSNYYKPWRSPWSWGFYPSYWSPWRPYYWDYYYGYHYNWLRHYLSYYRSWNIHRDSHWRDNYDRVRSSSRTVIIKRDRGDYKRTYSRPDQRSYGNDRFRKDNPRDNRRDNNYDRPGNDRRDNDFNRPGNDNNRRDYDNNRRDYNNRDNNRKPEVNRPGNDNNRKPEGTRPDVRKGEENRGSVIRKESTGERERSRPEVKERESNKGEVKREESKRSDVRSSERSERKSSEVKKADVKRSETKEGSSTRRSRERNKD